MRKKEGFKIPYRIETVRDIAEAHMCNFLHLGSGYDHMMQLAGQAKLHKPGALVKAKPFVEKTFYMLNEKIEKQAEITFEEIAGLDFIEDFQKIEKILPAAAEIAGYETLFLYLQHLPEPVIKLCRLEGQGHATAYDQVMSVRNFLRQEMLAFARTKNHKNLSLRDLRSLIAACAIFLPENEDVLQALRHSRHKAREALYQNALAELLFRRLLAFMEQLAQVDPAVIRRRLFEKTAQLGLSSRQRMHLHGYFKAHTRQKDMIANLERVAQASKKIVDAALHKKIESYVASLCRSITLVQRVYDEWFLTKELEVMKRLHVSVPMIKSSSTTYREVILKTCSELVTLKLFPVKDFLDLCKYNVSGDCTYLEHLAEPQLLCPNFFNIRVFAGNVWTGNIYMLDFTREHGVLLVDRIQIPRDIKADFIDFFSYLRQAFEELFRDVAYGQIIMPLKISNHYSIQKLYNRYRKRLKRNRLQIDSRYRDCFESLRPHGDYVVLCSKDEAANNSRQVERS